MAHDARVVARGVQELHPGKAGGPAHGHQATHTGADPVVQLVAQFIGLVELHGGDFVLVFPPGVGVGHKRFDDGGVGGERADNFEGQQGVLEMVEDAQAEDEVEGAQAGLGQLVEVQNAIADAGAELLLNLEEVGHFHAIDGGHRGAVALGFEAEPAVPGPDVQHTLAGQIRRDGKSRVAARAGCRSGCSPRCCVPSGSSKL